MRERRVRDVVIAAAVVAGTLGIGAAVGIGGWPGAPSGCVAAGDCSCEALSGGLLRQPVTALSSLALVIAGLWILGSPPAAPSNRFAIAHAYRRLFGAVVIVLGIGSLALHGTMTEWGGWLDLVAVDAFVLFLLFYDLAVLRNASARWFLTAFGAAVLIVAIVMWPLDKGYGKYGLAALLLATLVAEARLARRTFPVSRDRRWLVAALAAYGVGQAMWYLGRSGGPLCDPDSLLQPHAGWHLAAAIAAGLLFRYLSTERPEKRREDGTYRPDPAGIR